MIIRNPTLGAGNGRIGGLVGWASGTAQVLRQNVKPVVSQAPHSVDSRNLMRQASAFWKSISKSQRKTLAAYAASVSTKNGYQYFCPCINRALFANRNYHPSVSSLVPNDFNLRSWADRFYSGRPEPVDWQLIDEASQPMTLVITDVAFMHDYTTLDVTLGSGSGQQNYYTIKSSSEDFGLQFSFVFHFKRRKAAIRLFISNYSEFDHSGSYHTLIFEDLPSLFGGLNVDYTLADTIDLTIWAVTSQNFYEASIIAVNSFSV